MRWMLLLLAAVPIGSCAIFEASEEEEARTLEFETLLTSYPILTDTLITFVLDDERAQRAFVRRYPSPAALPVVDYGRYFVAGVLAGGRTNDRYGIVVDSVVAAVDRVTVHATETGSAAGERTVSYPAHVIRLERRGIRGLPVSFAPVRRVCLEGRCDWEF